MAPYAKQPVAGDEVPMEPCDARPFTGTTLKVVPFQVRAYAGAPDGHACMKGPPALVEVAHAMPAGGFEPFSDR